MSAQAKEAPTALQEQFRQAYQHHRAGRLDEAERGYRQLLTVDPRHADSLHLLGVLRARSARHGEAVDLISKALELRPDSSVGHSNLGISLRALGRLDEALACYDRAIQLKPDHAEAYDNLGNVWMDREQWDRAVTCYRRCLELRPDYADGHYNLGNALVRSGRLEEAIGAYREALRLEPEFVEAYNNLGVALAELGRCDAALAAYDEAASLRQAGFENPLANKALLLMEAGLVTQSSQVIDEALLINPGSASAWHIRSGLKKFASGDPDIDTMEALLTGLSRAATSAMSTTNLADQICMEFALGKAWLDVGDADRAFAHLNRGNRLKRATFAYDSTATHRWINDMAASFTPAHLKRLAGAGHPSELPVFIVGMPRSGTTLVEQILASHPEIHGAGELTLLEDMVARISGPSDELYPPGNPGRLAALLPEDVARLGRQYEAQVRALAQGRQRVLDKMPTNFLYAGLIHAILPQARIIHCRRDAVDTCFSCYTKLFRDVKFASDLRELGWYYRHYETLMEHWRGVLPSDRFIEVHYEAVVDDLEMQARRLVGFCGLPWHEACLAFHENPRAVRTASVTQVRRPIYRSSISRWKPYARHLIPLLEALGLRTPCDVA